MLSAEQKSSSGGGRLGSLLLYSPEEVEAVEVKCVQRKIHQKILLEVKKILNNMNGIFTGSQASRLTVSKARNQKKSKISNIVCSMSW